MASLGWNFRYLKANVQKRTPYSEEATSQVRVKCRGDGSAKEFEGYTPRKLIARSGSARFKLYLVSSSISSLMVLTLASRMSSPYRRIADLSPMILAYI